MEPEIIHMYSSSPPPLDNGADDDEEDEFGEFGGFSEVDNSSVNFADFDPPDYPNSKEDFTPPNHFLPIPGYCDVNSFSSTKTDKGCFAECSESTIGQSDILETITCNESIQSRTSNSPFDSRVNADYIRTRVQEKEHFVKRERLSPEVIGTEVNISNQEIRNCNGEKVHCLEILTNGFAVLDSVNPQGIEDLDFDSDSKGLKTRSTHSTAVSLDSRSSPSEVLSDCPTLSDKNTVQLEEIGPKVCRKLSDAEVPKSQVSNIINRVDGQSTEKAVVDPGTCANEEGFELEPEQGCIAEDSVTRVDGEDQSTTSWECETVVCSSTLPASLKSIEQVGEYEYIGGREKGESESTLKKTGNVDSSRIHGSAETINDSQKTINEDELGRIQAINSVRTDMVSLNDFGAVTNSDLGSDFANFPCTNKDDVGVVVSGMPPSTVEALESNGCQVLETTPETIPQFSESGGEFGDFGNVSTDLRPEFVTLDVSKKQQPWDALSDPCGTDSKFSDFPVRPFAHVDEEDDGEFGGFDSVLKSLPGRDAGQDFDDFADFSSASSNLAGEWNAFEDEQKGSTWAAFGDEQAVDSLSNEEEPWQPHRTEAPIGSHIDRASKDSAIWPTSHETETTVHCQDSTAALQPTLLGRLEQIFQVCFPAIPVPEVEETIPTLTFLLEKGEKQSKDQVKPGESLANSGQQLDVWMALQDIHDGYGLRYQWGGSHSNKQLLCSLGIDTRNILFTGNKKQPVIVPMYASGLGMLEPTKEPLKPVSAAEKITSIGKTPPVSPEIIPSDQLQESLPPVQFDWSSSGLTNPLDASGGSTLLNLDFFGPVDDNCSSSTTTMPGVDPELYELTTSKLETSNTSSKVTDAFARLMSTVEKTSTSTRKPKKEEHLSEEAVKVITSLPDLSFMHAKVLMFPATLTPSASCQEKVD